MSIFRIFAMLCVSVPCAAQTVSSAPSAPVDLSNVPTIAQVQAMQTAAIAAATPADCSSPAPDTLNGTAGSASRCMPRADASRPTAVQGGNATADAAGNIAVTFTRSTASTTPVVQLIPVASGSLPIVCNLKTRSTAGFTAGCWQSSTTTLGGSLTALLGLVVSPFSGGAAGAQVAWVAREPTQ